MTASVTIGTRRAPADDDSGDYYYTGVLRHNGKVIAECGHYHANRDMTGRNGTSASDCMRYTVRATIVPALRDSTAEKLRTAWQQLTAGAGFTFPKQTVARAKEDAEAEARAYLIRVTHLTETLARLGVTVTTNGCGVRFTTTEA